MNDDMQIGRYRLDTLANRLSGPEGEVALSPLGVRFLEILARAPGQVVDRHAIIDEIWRGDFLTGDPALHRVVSEIRRAVGENPRDPILIQTVHRRGYRLVVPELGEGDDIGWNAAPVPRRGLPQGAYWLIGILLTIIVATVAAIILMSELMALRYG